MERRGHLAELRALPNDHSAMVEMKTLYPRTVRSANPREWVLKGGINSTKLGSHFSKGPWINAPIFSLKLEERKTCPASCQQLATCYGNNMGRRTTRWNVDSHLYTRLNVELDLLSMRHRTYAIRLHDLGDFASVEYARFWIDALQGHPGLRIFGFTHWSRETEIGSLVEEESAKWQRFRVRFSDNHLGERTSHVIGHRHEHHALGFVCPANQDREDITCGSCSLCLTSKMPIVLEAH